jgi:hypothetical protein
VRGKGRTGGSGIEKNENKWMRRRTRRGIRTVSSVTSIHADNGWIRASVNNRLVRVFVGICHGTLFVQQVCQVLHCGHVCSTFSS